MKTKAVSFIALFSIIGVLVAIVALADAIGAWDVYRAQQQTRAAEAKTRELEAQAAVLRERQAILQTAALSFASTKDSLLVAFSYIMGGMMLCLSIVAIGLLLLERRDRHERTI